MKNIKNNFFSIFTLVFSLVLLTASCTDEDKDNLSVLNKDGGFVRFDENPPAQVGVAQISDLLYKFTLLDANNNVAQFDLKLYADIGGVRTDTVNVGAEPVTSFPADFSFTHVDLADLLNIDPDDIGFGDQFFFTGTAKTDDGEVYGTSIGQSLIEIFPQDDGTYLDGDGDEIEIEEGDRIVTTAEGSTFRLRGQGISADLAGESGYKQAFQFDFVILCPEVDLNALVGTYDVTALGFAGFFGETNFVREVILGPGSNQLTIVNGAYPAVAGEDLIINIDPDTSALSLGESALAFSADAGAFDTDNYGTGTSGFVFSCIGRIAIKLDFDTYAGNVHDFVLDKQ